ncbi:MAG: 30S ribosomal protein S17 [Candidatus Omnitrophica bacterium]|nr:30S ribosomal protein S17 [Candidatus Omnitrophota bacterium]
MKSRRKILEGVVTSAKMQKTIVVSVERIKKHSLYQKSSRDHKKFKAHDDEGKAGPGDLVKIVECRPYSKDKRFKLLEVIKKQIL